MGVVPTWKAPTTMPTELESFVTFLRPHCKSDDEWVALSDPLCVARRIAELTAVDGDEAEASRRLAAWAVALAQAFKGDARSARRMAEMCELAQDRVAARPWWRYAAALGDRDAQDYVKHIFGESAPTAAAEVADAPGAADDVSQR